MNACDLCGLPAGRHPLERRFPGGVRAFCCLGCTNVYSILHESGVLESGIDFRDTELFQESLRLGLISSGATRQKETVPDDAEQRETVYHLTGMWCSSCAWLIEHALQSERGLLSAEVMFASDLVKVKYCPQYLPPGRIVSRIAALGYRATEYTGQSTADGAERKDLLLRIGVAGFLWLNVMTLSLVIYASYWEAISESARRVVPFVLMALTTPAVFYSAWPILRSAWTGARHLTLRMEALLAVGILAAYAYSGVQAFAGGKHYYFDTACAIITLVLLGKLLERGAKEKTAQAISLLYRMMPSKARLLVSGVEKFVSIDALQRGMIFVVKPGERIPADGRVVAGASHVDESVITGESAPLAKQPESDVICGSLNTGGVLEVRATRVGASSTLNQIIRSVESAMTSRSHVERTVDRVSRAFAPFVIALAVATYAGWSLAGMDSAGALMRAIAVLVIACPCALGLATPLAITAAVGAASRRGILVSDSRVLETVRRVDVAILDKTGTVTEGDFRVVGIAPEAATESLAAVASIESYSEHPLGRAVARRAAELDLSLPPARDISIHKGMGISGVVAGSRIWIGNRRLMRECGGAIATHLESRAAAWEARGHTVAFFASEGTAIGAIAMGDSVRPDAARLVEDLRRRGIHTALISGDARSTTTSIASAIGVDDHQSEALPDEKLQCIRRYQAAGKIVAMLGDGINDAPALAAADLGIALGSGADLAMHAASVVLMTPALDRVTEVFDLAGDTLRVVKRNLFWAFFYNTAGITLAIAGILTPILAAAAMVLSSLSVIGNSLRLSRRFAPPKVRQTTPSARRPPARHSNDQVNLIAD
jgi:heavy metal translocating P-type ATPase